MNEQEARELAFRLHLRSVEPAKIAQALAREHGYRVEPQTVEQWTSDGLEQLDRDPQRARAAAVIAEANRELWASAAVPGTAPAAKAGYLQAIARNEERLLRLAQRTGEARPARYVTDPRPGRCGARGRGAGKTGLFCDELPVADRKRCYFHGGAAPRGAAHPSTKHGSYAQGAASGPEFLAATFGEAEQRLIDHWRRDPEDALRLQLAEGAVVQRRAMRAGSVESYTRLGTMIASTARALVSLREVPQAERGLPKLVEVFEGKGPVDFERDLEVIRRDASAGVAA